MKKTFLLLSLASILFSCSRRELDMDLANDLSFNPNFQLPLVNAKLSIANLVQEDSTLIFNPGDNSISIVFAEDSLFSFNAIDFVTIPRQTPTSVSLVEPALEFLSLNAGLGTLGGADLTDATFENGFLVYEVSTTAALGNDSKFIIRLDNAVLNGSTFADTVVLPGGALSVRDSIDIGSIEFDLSNGNTTSNFLSLYVGMDTATTPDNQNFDVSINFAGLTIDYAEGFFGNRVVNIPSGSFDFDLAGLEEFTNGLRLTNPKLNLIATGSLGFPIELGPKFDGVNADFQTQALGFTPQVIEAVPNPSVTQTDTIKINNTNSQIVDFLAIVPNQILYSGQSTLNPRSSDDAVPDFISKDTKLNIGMLVEIPLEFSATNMMLEQEISGINLTSGDSASLIESLTLFFNNKNGFPFDVNMSVSFIDSVTGDSIAGVQIPLLEAAPSTPGNGATVTQRTERSFSVTFGENEVEALSRVNAFLIRARLNTPELANGSGNKSIKLLTNYGLQTIISARTKLNISL